MTMTDDEWGEYDGEPEEALWPCAGRACENFPTQCPRDDCFVQRRAVGLPDMVEPPVALSQQVQEGVAWLETPVGKRWKLGIGRVFQGGNS